MERMAARVLYLPTMADAREEAQRMGLGPSDLDYLSYGSGGEALKLSGVPDRVAIDLQRLFSSHFGLAAIARPSPEEGDIGASQLADRQVDLLLSGSGGLLTEACSQLEASGGQEEMEVASEIRSLLDRYQGNQLGTTRCGSLTFEWGRRTYVMGIINVTPDSFSGDGLSTDVEGAVEQARRFVEAGADILDVGGESTRPGSEEVSVQQERDRVIPVIRRLAEEFTVPISVDSYKLLVVQESLEAGARMINDVWGLRRTEGLAALAAAYDVPIVLMHNRQSTAASTQYGKHFQKTQYADLMGEVVQELEQSVEMALQSNVKWENIIVDPGVGFGKGPEQNLVVMRRLREVRSLGRPILMGTSRKSTIGVVLGLPVEDRVEGTAATVAASICNGADIVRVHDVKEMARVSRMTDAIVRARGANAG